MSTKNPVLVEAGRRGASRRWGERRIVRLTDLPPDVAAVIRQLVDASERAKRADAA